MRNMSSKIDSTLFVVFGSAAFGFTLAPLKLLGLFFIHMQRDFDATASKVSLCIGLISALSFLYGPIDALVYNQIGARSSVLIAAASASFGLTVSSVMSTIDQITVVYAVFSAFGIGMMNLAFYTMSGHIFSCRLSLVNNLLSSSHSIVTIAFAPVTQLLIEYYGWRGTLLLLGGATVHAFPASMLATKYYSKVTSSKTKRALEMITMTEDESQPRNGVADGGSARAQTKNDRKSLRDTVIAAKTLLWNPYFVVYVISMTFASISRLSVLLYTVRYAQSTGITDKNAAWILTLQELLSIVSGPLAGYLTSTESKRKGSERKNKDESGFFRRARLAGRKLQYVPRSYAHAILSLSFSVSILIPVAFQTSVGFVTSGVLNGIIMGANTALPVTVLTDFFKGDDIVTAQGIRSLLAGIGFIVYPWMVGTVIDSVGNYIPAQIFAASFSLASAVFTVITQLGLKRRTKICHKEIFVVQRDETDVALKENKTEDQQH